MTVARLKTDDTACLLIDVQDRLLDDMHEPDRLVHRNACLAATMGVLGVPVVVTEHVKRVFGETAQPVLDALPPETPMIQKSQFSACIDPVLEILADLGKPNIVVSGMEAHICVLQTSLDLLRHGYRVWLVSDAISGGEQDQVEPALCRCEGAGAIVTGYVSLTYELLWDGKHPDFKKCLQFVKEVRG